jgi:hypoxanthine-DNA glycosylase
MIKEGLPPIIDENTRIIMLGSFPSDESIKQKKYYANKTNDFWKLISKTIKEDITKLNYEDRVKKLLENGIGLWDVFHHCNRAGSRDSNIKDAVMNDFSSIFVLAPGLKLICFNGKKAGQYEQLFRDKGYQTKLLLSSSGANRGQSKKREAQWKSLLELI